MTSINQLPDEILEQIMLNLPPYEDLKNCALVCKRWTDVVHSVRHLTNRNLMRGLVDTSRLVWRTYPQPTPAPLPPPAVAAIASTSRSPSAAAANVLRSPSQASTAPPIAARFSHSAIVHQSSMFVFGGGSSHSTTFNDLWRFDLSTRRWHRPETRGDYPMPKACASIAVHRDRLIVFGGWRHPSLNMLHESWQLFDELHSYHIGDSQWTRHRGASAERGPPPMTGHVATVHGTRMVIFGGFQSQPIQAGPGQAQFDVGYDGCGGAEERTGCANSVWCLDLVTMQWHQRATSLVRPAARYGHVQTRIDDDRMLVMGGCGGPNNMFTDAWLLHMVGEVWRWQQVSVGNRRWTATHMWCNPACRIGSRIVLLGPTTCSAADLQLHPPNRATRGPAVAAAAAAVDNIPPQQQPPQQQRHPNHAHHQRLRHEEQLQEAAQQPPPPPVVAPPPKPSPSQIVAEANRRLQADRERRAAETGRPVAGSANSSATGGGGQRQHGPGPSSGVLVPASERRRRNSSSASEDDEDAVNRRLKRNLQLKSRDDDADQLMPKRFNQPQQPEPQLGMSAFAIDGGSARSGGYNAGTAGLGAAGGLSGCAAGSSSSNSSGIQQRLETLRRMEEKIRAIQMRVEAPAMDIDEESDDDDDDDDDVHLEFDDAADHGPLVAADPVGAAVAAEAGAASGARERRSNPADSIGVYICDISPILEQSAANGADGEQLPPASLNWMELTQGGHIEGAPERLILTSLVAGSGELIMFGGLRRESMMGSCTDKQVSNALHFLSVQRDGR